MMSISKLGYYFCFFKVNMSSYSLKVRPIANVCKHKRVHSGKRIKIVRQHLAGRFNISDGYKNKQCKPKVNE